MNNGARLTIWFRYVNDTFTLFHNKDTYRCSITYRCLRIYSSALDDLFKLKNISCHAIGTPVVLFLIT